MLNILHDALFKCVVLFNYLRNADPLNCYLPDTKHLLSHSLFFSSLLHPLAAADPLTVEFALEVRRDSQFSGLPEALHLTGEVFGELG